MFMHDVPYFLCPNIILKFFKFLTSLNMVLILAHIFCKALYGAELIIFVFMCCPSQPMGNFIILLGVQCDALAVSIVLNFCALYVLTNHEKLIVFNLLKVLSLKQS